MSDLFFTNGQFLNHFNKISPERIVAATRTPFFLYSGETIEDRYRYLLDCIEWDDTRLFYAMKSNYNPEILKLLLRVGSGIDAVSPAEVFLALECGFSAGRIIFTSNNATDEEIAEVVQSGVLINIDSLSRLEKFAKDYSGGSVCLRFNSDVVAGEHKHIMTGGDETKFGILRSDADRAADICRRSGLRVCGIHNHTGSGIADIGKYIESMENLLSIINKDRFPDLEFVDFGGGFKAPYAPDEKIVDYPAFGKAAGNNFAQFCSRYGRKLSLYIEPGKYITAESAIFVVQVNTLKDNRGRQIAGVNSGFPHLIRPVLYQAYHHIVNLSNPGGRPGIYDVCGNICESGDRFAVQREIAEIREGDYLAILNAGAYCFSMASVYNLRPLPSEVFLYKNEMRVRKAMSNRELAMKIYEAYSDQVDAELI